MNQLDRIDQSIRTLLVIVQHIKATLDQHCAACTHPCGSNFPMSDSAEGDQSPLMTAKDVQNLFGIVHSTYYRWIDRGVLTPIVIGGKHYYDPDQIQRILHGRRYRQRGGLLP